jgi:uncharacterized DUF497 family protein
MTFEYDEAKSRINKDKHGIDFVEAQALWLDEQRLEVPASCSDEQRFLIFAKIDSKYWTAVITYRGKNIRIISVRRSRDNEKQCYERPT